MIIFKETSYLLAYFLFFSSMQFNANYFYQMN